MAQLAYKFPRKTDEPGWPAQGEWTYEDYRRLPEDGQRHEIIRGFLYVTAAPFPEHQFSVVKLSRFFDEFVSAAGLGMVLAAPFDVKLPAGIASPIQPDVAFFRKGNEPHWGVGCFEGVPDLIVEVLSPRTRRRDQTLKRDAYEEAGVPEYWLVDPKAWTVVIYVLGRDKRYSELVRAGEGGTVGSSVLPDLRVNVSDLFMPSPR